MLLESSSSETEDVSLSTEAESNIFEKFCINDTSETSQPHSSTSGTLSSIAHAPLKKKRRFNVFDDKFASSLDVAKLSDRGVAVVITPFLQNVDLNPEEFNVSYATIRRKGVRHSKAIAEKLKAKFQPQVPLTIHWDGKLLPDITGKETVNGFPLLVSGVDQLLPVPKLPLRIGEAVAAAVHEAALSWGVRDKIKAMSFDTTSVNSERLNGACVLLEQKIERNIVVSLSAPCSRNCTCCSN